MNRNRRRMEQIGTTDLVHADLTLFNAHGSYTDSLHEIFLNTNLTNNTNNFLHTDLTLFNAHGSHGSFDRKPRISFLNTNRTNNTNNFAVASFI